MKPFRYQKADSVEHALELKQQFPNAKFIGGGTNLLDLMKLEIETPGYLIDVSHTGLDSIERLADGGLAIGASVTNSALAADMTIREDYPVLSRALLAGASGQLRNKASTGGNLLQRTRCPYFYDTAQACNKRLPGSGCSAAGGFSRQLAVVDINEDCIASFPSDMAVAMRVLDAQVELTSPQGQRRVPLKNFYTGSQSGPDTETVLKPDELITRVILPPPPGGTQFYEKVRDRASYAFALVSAAVIILPDGRVKAAFGGVAPMPWRDESAETQLPANVDGFIQQAFADASPTHENEFKIPLANQIIKSLLAQYEEAEA